MFSSGRSMSRQILEKYCLHLGTLGKGVMGFLEFSWEVPHPPPCLPARHGVLFFVQFIFARTSSGTSADVRESDRGERDSSLSGGRPPEIPENVAL